MGSTAERSNDGSRSGADHGNGIAGLQKVNDQYRHLIEDDDAERS
jgi:hypothetical protein